jgi:hypothetical protein
MKVIGKTNSYPLSAEDVRRSEDGTVFQGASGAHYLKGEGGMTKLDNGFFSSWSRFGGGQFRKVEAEVHIK